jgi:hypothetical protein
MRWEGGRASSQDVLADPLCASVEARLREQASERASAASHHPFPPFSIAPPPLNPPSSRSF